ncbi:MAG: hypothetical protein B6I30_01135 [Desulfobacteraceae bacterium 4572_187]|nr:MAG: hypothetical protein B6I30_01135 [Desulfobacteraceae bacterium 4572_187]
MLKFRIFFIIVYIISFEQSPKSLLTQSCFEIIINKLFSNSSHIYPIIINKLKKRERLLSNCY